MSIDNFFGKVCEIVLPIHEEKYLGNLKSDVAVCTLSSIDLMKKLVKDGILEDIALIGRLLSENKGIDSLITNTLHYNIKKILLCGKEVTGHKTGDSLLMLYKNGVDNKGIIIGSTSPNPYLTVSKKKMDQFRKKIIIVDRLGEKNVEKLISEIKTLTDQ